MIERPMNLTFIIDAAIAMIALLLFSGVRYPGFRVEESSQMGSDITALLATVFLYSMLLLMVVLCWRSMERVGKYNQLFLVLTLLPVVSALWSHVPEFSFRRGLGVAMTSAVGMYLGNRFSLKQMVNVLTFALLAGIGLCLIATIIVPEKTIHYDAVVYGDWRGLFIHKNMFGRFIALTITVLALQCPRNIALKMIRWYLIFGCFCLLYYVHSATAILVSVAMVAITRLIPIVRFRSNAFLITGMGLVLALSVGGVWASEQLGSIAALLGRDTSLTGRTGLWGLAFDAAMKRPLLGHGTEGFWQQGRDGPASGIMTALNWVVPHAHNGLLEIFIELGLLGVVLSLAVYALAMARAVKLTRQDTSPYGAWPVCYLIFVVLYNITESTFMRRGSMFWMLLGAVTMQLARARAEELQARKFQQAQNESAFTGDLYLSQRHPATI
jgi:exopolysaccharide production protein ExoQ